MSNKQWDDLPRELTPEEVQGLNVDDILKDIEPQWLEPQLPLEEEQSVRDDNVAAQAETEGKKPTGWQKHFLMYLHDVVYLLAALVVVFLLVFRVVVVSGTSMNNTLYDGDYLFLLGNTFYHDPSCGDVIVASKECFDNGAPIVKRVIATEGQWVDIRNGIVYVGDSVEDMYPVEETYTKGHTSVRNPEDYPLEVKDGCLFVMGDNRERSLDSRSDEIGLIDKREVLGKVFFLFLPGTNEGSRDQDFGRVGVVN